MSDTVRRERIRAENAGHRAAAVGLRNSIRDIPAKDLVRSVLYTFDDVDHVFLASKEDRTAEREAWWLDCTENVLRGAVKTLHDITELVHKYGGPEKIQVIRPF